MGGIHEANLKAGIKINGVDILDIHPDDVKKIIAGDETGIIKASIQSKLDEFEVETVRGRDDYAKKYGRPDLKEVPFGGCENDGYLYLDGHAPNCSGPDPSYVGGCWCKWLESNANGGPMWVGGPDMDDFDM